MAHGSIEYCELHSKDLAQTRSFYEKVFGWKFGEPTGDYLMFQDGGGNAGGGFSSQVPAMTGGEGGGAHLYVTVDSIEQTLATVAGAGGKQTKGKTVIDDSIGWWASFTDPSGNLIGIYEKK